MTESPNVLVASGRCVTGHRPQQSYGKKLFTTFNMLGQFSDADFYNQAIAHTEIEGVSDFGIYGFMAGQFKYTYPDSIQKIVDLFQRHSQIDIIICDILTNNNAFEAYQHIHPQSITNTPFFINHIIKNKIKFSDDPMLFKMQLEELQQQGHIIFHIAEPLLTLVPESSV